MKIENFISLVIPVYNEEESIDATIRISDEYLRNITKNYEIIVVDDGSDDKTGKIIDECANTCFHVKPIHNIRNEGSGKSLFIGFKNARGEFLVSNFADMPFDIRELQNILHLFKESGADFVVVSRKDRKANSIYRKITSLANYWLIRLFFNVRVNDFQFVQVYKKKVLDAVKVQSKGTFVPPEIIIKALSMGFKMEEYLTDFHPRILGSSKCGNFTVIGQTIYEIVRFWFIWVILRCRH